MRELQLKALKAIMIFAYIVQDDHKLDVVVKWARDEFGIENLEDSEWSKEQCDQIIKCCTAERALNWQPNEINTDAGTPKARYILLTLLTFIMFLMVLVFNT